MNPTLTTPAPQVPKPEIGVVPLPMAYTMHLAEGAGPDGKALVLIIFTTPAGQNCFFFDPASAEQFAADVLQFATQARTGIVLPSSGLTVPGQRA